MEKPKDNKFKWPAVILLFGFLVWMYVMSISSRASSQGPVGPIEYYYYPPTNGVAGPPMATCILSNKSDRVIAIRGSFMVTQKIHHRGGLGIIFHDKQLLLKRLPTFLEPGEIGRKVFQLQVDEDDYPLILNTNEIVFEASWSGYAMEKVFEIAGIPVPSRMRNRSRSKTFTTPLSAPALKDSGKN